MYKFLATARCVLEGAARKNVIVDFESRFNRSRIRSGLGPIRGSKRYPVRVSKSRIAGNVAIDYGARILNSDLNSGSIGEVTVGRFSSVNGTQASAGDGTISIGSFCSIADGARLLVGSHRMTRATTSYVFRHVFKDAAVAETSSRGGITLEHDVWLGANVIVLDGVTVGRGSVVGAGAVVTRDVQPYSVMGGNPARLIRMRFDPSTIEMLEDSHWWDWGIDELLERRDFFEVDL